MVCTFSYLSKVDVNFSIGVVGTLDSIVNTSCSKVLSEVSSALFVMLYKSLIADEVFELWKKKETLNGLQNF